MITLTLTCSNDACAISLPLPITLQSVFPRVENSCTVCKQGFLLISNIQGVEPSKLSKTDFAADPSPPKRDATIYAPGGNRIFTAFQNRLAPLVVAVQLIEEMSDENEEVDFNMLAKEFKKRSNCLRRHLAEKLEAPLGVGRGQKLSDGFPSIDNEGTTNIALRNYLGVVGSRLMPGIGLLQEFELVKLVDNTKFRLKSKARPLLDLDNLYGRLMATEMLKDFQNSPVLPIYYNDEFALKLSNAIAKVAPDHFYWLMEILEKICDCEKEEGWSSNEYAGEETRKAIQGYGHPRWSLSNNQHATLLDKFKAQAEKKRQDGIAIANYARHRHENHINGKLGSALSHLKELGFIVPVTVGNSKNFFSTQRGQDALGNFKEMME